MTGEWHGVVVTAPPDRLETITAWLWDYDLTGLEEGETEVTAYRAEPWDQAELRARLPEAAAIRFFAVPDQDWDAVWKASWTPTPLGDRLLVIPAWWREPVDADRIVIRIDPGRAFGTGTHESTRLAWVTLEACLAPGERAYTWLLDVGTGTGVLALGALLLRPDLQAVTTEADPQAVASLRPNLMASPAAPRFGAVLAAALPLRAGCADLIVANLTAAEHEAVDAGIARAAAPQCTLVLSGFMRGQETAAVGRWAQRRFAETARRVDGDWVALRFDRV